MNSQIAIRCDGTSITGAGHVARCLWLSEALRKEGFTPLFIGNYDGVAEWLLKSVDASIVAPTSNKTAGVDPNQVLAAVVDLYSVDEEEICSLAEVIPVATFGEAKRCHRSGVWIDYHLDRAGEDATSTLLPGPKYAPLDPALEGIGNPGEVVNTVLVTVGGSSAAQALMPMLIEEARAAFRDATILVAASDPPKDRKVEKLPYPGRMRDVLPKIDFAISGAGLTAYELACAGVPSLLLQLADNQRRVVEGCRRAGISLTCDPTREAVRRSLQELLDPTLRSDLALTGKTHFDGFGPARIAAALIETWGLSSPRL